MIKSESFDPLLNQMGGFLIAILMILVPLVLVL